MTDSRPFIVRWRDYLLSENGPPDRMARLVGAALANRANRAGGSCFPSQRTLAVACHCTERTVRTAVEKLSEFGWIETESETVSGGPQGTAWRTNYRLLIPEEAEGISGSYREEAENASGSSEKRRKSTTEEAEILSAEVVSNRTTTHMGDEANGGGGPSPTADADAQPTERSNDVGASSGHGRDYPAEFEAAWAAYPPRTGGNPKKAAYDAWRARTNTGTEPGELLAGVERYAAFCEATGTAGSQYVKQARTFFGPGGHWEEEYEIPAEYQPKKRRVL